MTGVGPDRPGIVEGVSKILAEGGFNIEDSKMAVLGGRFAMLLSVSQIREGSAPLEERIPEMERESGLKFTFREFAAESSAVAGIPFRISGFSLDHPGIVHALAREVADLGANIEEMETTTRNAPVSGTPLFDVEMTISLPVEISIKRLRRSLEAVGERENIDVSVEPADD